MTASPNAHAVPHRFDANDEKQMFGTGQVQSSAAYRHDGYGSYTAVIDAGSGSARAVVMQVNPGGGIEIVAQQRVNLNLMRHVDEDGVLDKYGVANTVDALEDFALRWLVDSAYRPFTPWAPPHFANQVMSPP